MKGEDIAIFWAKDYVSRPHEEQPLYIAYGGEEFPIAALGIAIISLLISAAVFVYIVLSIAIV